MNKTFLMQQCLAFAENSLRPEAFAEMTHDERLINGLGKLMSLVTDYDGNMILEATYKALEDANNHAEAETLKREFRLIG